MRTFVLALALLAAGCASGGGLPGQPPRTAPQLAPRLSSAPLTARVVLGSPTMAAGSSMSARVIVQNNTGRAIHASGCLSLFQVVLVSSTYQPDVAWFTCLQAITIPTGRSSHRVTIAARYNQCEPSRSRGGGVACQSGQPPPLPPGDYHATLFQTGHLFPPPPAQTVHVTPSVPAA